MTKEAILNRRTYPRSAKELIIEKAQIESEWAPFFKPAPLPKYEKKGMEFTLTSAVAFGGNIIKSILP